MAGFLLQVGGMMKLDEEKGKGAAMKFLL